MLPQNIINFFFEIFLCNIQNGETMKHKTRNKNYKEII